MTIRRRDKFVMASKINRCQALWKPQGKKYYPSKVCLFCGEDIIYKNDGTEITGSTAEYYKIKPGYYHNSFMLSFMDGKLGNPKWRKEDANRKKND